MKSLFALLLISTSALASDNFRLEQDIVLPARTNQLLLPAGEIQYHTNGVSQSHCYIQFSESSSERTLRRGTQLEVFASARLNSISQFSARTPAGEQFTFTCSKRVEEIRSVFGHFTYSSHRFEDLDVDDLAELPSFVNDDDGSKSEYFELSEDEAGASHQ